MPGFGSLVATFGLLDSHRIDPVPWSRQFHTDSHNSADGNAELCSLTTLRKSFSVASRILIRRLVPSLNVRRLSVMDFFTLNVYRKLPLLA